MQLTSKEIVRAAMYDRPLDGLKYPEQYLYNAIRCIKYDYERGVISKDQANSMVTYERSVSYPSLKNDEEFYHELSLMVLEICKCEYIEDVKKILNEHGFTVDCGQAQTNLEG